jgi:putative sterol carrier protein
MKVLGQLYGDRRSPYLNEGEQLFFVVHLNDGKCTDYYQVDVPPPRKEFDFIFEIPAVVFEEVAAGLADPVAAGLKGTIKVTGDMRILIRHADLVNVVQQVYTREVQTTWPKGKPPYAK